MEELLKDQITETVSKDKELLIRLKNVAVKEK